MAFERDLHGVRVRADRMFAALLIVQWVLALALALVISPFGWDGVRSHLHFHVKLVLVFGTAINAAPLLLIVKRPGWWGTRHAVAVAQMLWSAMLITVTGGRIETHFHIFGSLAFLAFYRDWRVLATATLVVAADHLARGMLWPEAVYGVANPEWWRFAEHAAWVGFEDVVLVLAGARSLAEMRTVATREAALAKLQSETEHRAREATAAHEQLAREMTSRLKAEAELRQAQKLESVGRLAAGIAHEINTPVQFVTDSLHFLRDASTSLLGVVGTLEAVHRSVLDGAPSRAAAEAASAAQENADLEYLTRRVPRAIERSLDGLGRVASIVRSMKAFAHPDSIEPTLIDLNAAIESTLVIARTEYKYVADLVTDLQPLPQVRCFAGDINQAVLNVLVNAAHAIGDVVKGTETRGKITVQTVADGDDIVISISDTGGGIPAEIRDRIFDPFFTTKGVGQGTGQGLAIVHSVIAEKHGGSIEVNSELGHGTTFRLRFPASGPKAKRAEAA